MDNRTYVATSFDKTLSNRFIQSPIHKRSDNYLMWNMYFLLTLQMYDCLKNLFNIIIYIATNSENSYYVLSFNQNLNSCTIVGWSSHAWNENEFFARK